VYGFHELSLTECRDVILIAAHDTKSGSTADIFRAFRIKKQQEMYADGVITREARLFNTLCCLP
jgi:hypothetical protein